MLSLYGDVTVWCRCSKRICPEKFLAIRKSIHTSILNWTYQQIYKNRSIIIDNNKKTAIRHTNPTHIKFTSNNTLKIMTDHIKESIQNIRSALKNEDKHNLYKSTNQTYNMKIKANHNTKHRKLDSEQPFNNRQPKINTQHRIKLILTQSDQISHKNQTQL